VSTVCSSASHEVVSQCLPGVQTGDLVRHEHSAVVDKGARGNPVTRTSTAEQQCCSHWSMKPDMRHRCDGQTPLTAAMTPQVHWCRRDAAREAVHGSGSTPASEADDVVLPAGTCSVGCTSRQSKVDTKYSGQRGHAGGHLDSGLLCLLQAPNRSLLHLDYASWAPEPDHGSSDQSNPL